MLCFHYYRDSRPISNVLTKLEAMEMEAVATIFSSGRGWLVKEMVLNILQ